MGEDVFRRKARRRRERVSAVGTAAEVAVRSSMNLNPNNRIESFDLSCDDALCGFFERAVDRFFEVLPRHRGGKASQSPEVFRRLLEVFECIEREQPLGKAGGWGKSWPGAA